MFIDSHCHLDCIDLQHFDNNFDTLIKNIRQQQVDRMLCVSINLERYQHMRELVAAYEFVDVSVGNHPSDTAKHASEFDELQKVVFAKWLQTGPRILLLDDPTRGIDVGSKFEAYELIASLKEEGCGILMISSELPELLGLSDRIQVMREGAVVREIARAELSQEEVLRAALMSEVLPDA